MKNALTIEEKLLDMRYFIDEALTFIESYHSNKQGYLSSIWKTNSARSTFAVSLNELSKTRQFAIEFTRLIYELKHALSVEYGEYNTAVIYSITFKKKRTKFFAIVFRRLDLLYKYIKIKLNEKEVNAINSDELEYEPENSRTNRDAQAAKSSKETNLHKELDRLYFGIVQKIARTTNEFIGYLEASHWNRLISYEILDRLNKLANDFLFLLERLLLSENENKIKQKNATTILSSNPVELSSSLEPEAALSLSLDKVAPGAQSTPFKSTTRKHRLASSITSIRSGTVFSTTSSLSLLGKKCKSLLNALLNYSMRKIQTKNGLLRFSLILLTLFLLPISTFVLFAYIIRNVFEVSSSPSAQIAQQPQFKYSLNQNEPFNVGSFKLIDTSPIRLIKLLPLFYGLVREEYDEKENNERALLSSLWPTEQKRTALNKPATNTKIEAHSLICWNDILKRMSNIYYIIGSLLIYVIAEWLVYRRFIV
jgi:hypothetical protein